MNHSNANLVTNGWSASSETGSMTSEGCHRNTSTRKGAAPCGSGSESLTALTDAYAFLRDRFNRLKMENVKLKTENRKLKKSDRIERTQSNAKETSQHPTSAAKAETERSETSETERTFAFLAEEVERIRENLDRLSNESEDALVRKETAEMSSRLAMNVIPRLKETEERILLEKDASLRSYGEESCCSGGFTEAPSFDGEAARITDGGGGRAVETEDVRLNGKGGEGEGDEMGAVRLADDAVYLSTFRDDDDDAFRNDLKDVFCLVCEHSTEMRYVCDKLNEQKTRLERIRTNASTTKERLLCQLQTGPKDRKNDSEIGDWSLVSAS